MRTIALPWLLVLACAGSASRTPPDEADDARGGCRLEALGLAGGREVEIWQAPTGCTITPPQPGAPTTIRNAGELAAHVTCTGDPGLDFTRHDLVLVRRTLSPAGVGTMVVDDGTTVTLVAQSQPNCEGDPMPMPMDVPLAFLLPAGSTRAWAEATCTRARRCGN